MNHRFNRKPGSLGVEESGRILRQFATLWEMDHLLSRFVWFIEAVVSLL